MDRRTGTMRSVLALRRPELGMYTLVIVPVIVISSLTISITLLGNGNSTLGPVVGPPAITVLALTVSLLVMLSWVWVVPTSFYTSSNFALAAWASYSPFLLAGLSGGWTGLLMRNLIFPDEADIPFNAVVSIIALDTVIFVVVGLLTNHLSRMLERQKEHEAALAQKVEELEDSRRRIVETQETLKTHVAESLHGGVQNRLVLVSHHLQQATDLLEGDPAKAGGAIQTARDLVLDINENDLRVIAKQLHPAIVKVGIAPALRSLANNFPGSASVSVEISQEIQDIERPGGEKLEIGLRLVLYRVAEEALTNAAKHGEPGTVVIELGLEQGGMVSLQVRDDGRGFDSETESPGFGILTMRDYAGALGGELSLESQPGKGARVGLILPVKFRARGGNFGDAATTPAPALSSRAEE